MDRFRTRARELRAFAARITPLANMPDRATGADLQLAVDLATKAADSLDALLNATPPGCLCHLIENDNYSYLDYAKDCRHHGQYFHLREKLKADFAKMEKALTNEVRMKLVTAALTGTAGVPGTMTNNGRDNIVIRALDLADETIRRLMEGT